MLGGYVWVWVIASPISVAKASLVLQMSINLLAKPHDYNTHVTFDESIPKSSQFNKAVMTELQAIS